MSLRDKLRFAKFGYGLWIIWKDAAKKITPKMLTQTIRYIYEFLTGKKVDD